VNILLTCVGRRNYIVDYFKNALMGIGHVYGANSTKYSSGLITTDCGFVCPSIYSSQYINSVISICKSHNINTIISLFDLELPILEAAKQELSQQGITTVLSSSDVINISNDKWETRKFLGAVGISHPKTFVNLESTLEALSKGEIRYPLILKPRWGTGSIGLFSVNNSEELIVLYQRAKNTIQESYLPKNDEQNLENSVLIQEKLTGKEYGLDIINDLKATYVTTFVKEKVAMRSGETDAAITVDHPNLRTLGAKISSCLNHVSILDVDVLVTRNKPYVLDINPRFGGGYPFSHLAGANIPAAVIAWLRGVKPDPSWFEIKYGMAGVKGIQPMALKDE
jgi:carbamoyl-phosphate synthase large subunit